MSLRPPEIVLSELERTELERLVRTHTAAQQLVTRAWIILAAGDGQNNAQIARWLGLDDETPGFWRQRWLDFRNVPLEELSVPERLADAPRPGAPAKFSQWSHRELADEIVRRGIVGSISPRHAGRLLKRSRSQATSNPVLVGAGSRRATRRT